MDYKAIFVSLLTIIPMFGFTQKNNSLDWFDSIESKNRVLSIYEQQLQNLPFKYQEMDVSTTYGNTHVIEAGEQGKPALVLVHGTNASAPAVLDAFAALEKNYHIFAIDVIGQPNKSSSIRPNMKGEAYGKWLVEVLNALEVEDVQLVGISFGGFLCMKAAAFDGSRIDKLTLISSAGIAQGSVFKMYFNAFVPMKKFKKTQKEVYFEKFLESSITDASRWTLQSMKEILLHYTMDTSPIPKISKREATNIHCPMLVFASKQDMFFPGEKVLKRAKKLFPTFNSGHLLAQSLHVPSNSDVALIVDLLDSE